MDYHTREVRDLAWACFSPPLLLSPGLAQPEEAVSNCGLGLTDARRSWLERLDRDARPLLEHLARRRGSRLGIYFEQLWHFFLTEDPAVDLVAHNLPVRADGRTIGEFDCLYYCRERRRHVHLELAVKYYLGYQCAAAGRHRDGPCPARVACRSAASWCCRAWPGSPPPSHRRTGATAGRHCSPGCGDTFPFIASRNWWRPSTPQAARACDSLSPTGAGRMKPRAEFP